MHRCDGHRPLAAPLPSSNRTARGMLVLMSPRTWMVAWRRPRAPPARVTGPSVSGHWPSRGYPASLQPDVSQLVQSWRGLLVREAA